MFDFTRASFDASLVYVALMALIAAWLMRRSVRAGHNASRPAVDECLELLGASCAALLGTALLTGPLVDALPIQAAFLASAIGLGYVVPRLNMPGVIWLTAEVLGLCLASLWGGHFLVEAGLPWWMEQIGLVGLIASVALVGAGLAARVAREAILTHHHWRLPTEAPAPFSGARRHRVSVQLPCYAEPPEVVQETMNRLAALDYDNFEVLVCDNNTRDEALWRPLEAHCRRLNARLGVERFRFFHVAPLPGAKAGALNYCLDHMDPAADLVAVIDADYLSRSDFLSRLTAFFDDPRVAYVQTPHDYRDYDGSDYLTACYWEYMPNNKIDMRGVSEYGGAFTIGTMCILRTEALRRAGGWAEWCLTEDSEISVRLRACGYEGIYLGETFGRGLIPDTFEDYRKQRFRWTAGPVQQLRRHWRLFLPAPFAPALPGWTKVLEVLRCVSPIQSLLGLIVSLLSTAVVVSAVLGGAMHPVDMPDVTWLLLAIGAATWALRTRLRYELSGCNRIADMMRGEVARMALTYVVLVAGVAGLSSRPLAWRRTPKFAPTGVASSALAAALPETVLGTLAMLLALAALLAMPLLGSEMAVLVALGLGTLGLRFLCAPYMALLANRHLRGAHHPVAISTPEGEPLLRRAEAAA